MKIKGASIVVNCLLEQGTDTVFGYPGVSILEVYDELYKKRKSIRHILTAHEQGAAHAADGYARSSGKTGVCLATSGPGATNLITGIAAAFMDSSPVVFITCNVDDELLGRDAFQEVDIVGISMPITKASFLIDKPENIADTLREAFAIARAGRPGPVLIDITHNATVEKAEYTFIPEEEHLSQGRLTHFGRGGLGLTGKSFREEDVIKACRMLSKAKRPLILAGGGVIRSGACALLKEFSEKNNIPVITTLMGTGSLPQENRLNFGMAGCFGCSQANFAVQSCDLLLALGVRFSERLTGKAEFFAPSAEIIHIDIDRSEIDKNISTAHHIIGDAKEILLSLLNNECRPQTADNWLSDIEKAGGEAAEASFPEIIIKAVHELCPDAIIATDVGQHQMWTCRNYPFSKPGRLITSGGYGAMGFGLGAAIGAKAGNPGETVIHITGDGSFGMNMNELITELRENLGIITIIFDNSALGLVRQNQTLNYGKRYSQTNLIASPDYSLIAEAYGMKAMRAESPEEFKKALDILLGEKRGGIIDCIIDKNEMIKPMLEKGRLTY